MGKIDNFFSWMYESDYEAINQFITESAQKNGGFCTQDGFDLALGYLCFNDIKHSYTVTTVYGVSLVCIEWNEGGEEQNYLFWGKGVIK